MLPALEARGIRKRFPRFMISDLLSDIFTSRFSSLSLSLAHARLAVFSVSHESEAGKGWVVCEGSSLPCKDRPRGNAARCRPLEGAVTTSEAPVCPRYLTRCLATGTQAHSVTCWLNPWPLKLVRSQRLHS